MSLKIAIISKSLISEGLSVVDALVKLGELCLTVVVGLILVFSLTKYSAIVVDVKEYFGIDGCDNQLRLRM